MLHRFDWAGCAAYLRSDDPEIVARVSAYFDLPAEDVADDPALTPAAAVSRSGDGWRVVMPHGEARIAAVDDAVFLILEAVAYRFAVETRRLVVHASGFVAGGSAVVCFGAPFAGKSSMAFAAWRRGMDVLGDDRICLDPATMGAAVYPKCLKLRLDDGAPPAHMSAALDRDDAFVGVLRGDAGDDRRLVLSRRLPGFVGYDAALPLRALVRIERWDGRESCLDTVPVVDVLDDILTQAMLSNRSPMELVRMIKAHTPDGRLVRLRVAPDDTDAGLDLLRGM